MISRFVLISTWHVHAPLTRVWEALWSIERWPRWWPQLAGVDCLVRGDPSGVGAQHRLVWRTRLGYRFSTVVTTLRVDEPREIEGSAGGDVAGTGLWTLDDFDGSTTHVTYRWDIRLERRWMRVSAPLLRPLFARNHFAVMRDGALGLGRELGCAVETSDDWAGSPRFAGVVGS